MGADNQAESILERNRLSAIAKIKQDLVWRSVAGVPMSQIVITRQRVLIIAIAIARQEQEPKAPGSEAGSGRGLGEPRNPIILDAALRPHKALDRVRKHEKMGLTIRGVVLDDLLGRNSSPSIIEPSIPDVV